MTRTVATSATASNACKPSNRRNTGAACRWQSATPAATCERPRLRRDARQLIGQEAGERLRQGHSGQSLHEQELPLRVDLEEDRLAVGTELEVEDAHAEVQCRHQVDQGL